MSPKQKGIPKIFYDNPRLIDVAHPFKTLKSLKTTSKTLGQNLKELKKEVDKIEQLEIIKNAQSYRKKAIIKGSKEELQMKKAIRSFVRFEPKLKKIYKNVEGIRTRSYVSPTERAQEERIRFFWK